MQRGSVLFVGLGQKACTQNCAHRRLPPPQQVVEFLIQFVVCVCVCHHVSCMCHVCHECVCHVLQQGEVRIPWRSL